MALKDVPGSGQRGRLLLQQEQWDWSGGVPTSGAVRAAGARPKGGTQTRWDKDRQWRPHGGHTRGQGGTSAAGHWGWDRRVCGRVHGGGGGVPTPQRYVPRPGDPASMGATDASSLRHAHILRSLPASCSRGLHLRCLFAVVAGAYQLGVVSAAHGVGTVSAAATPSATHRHYNNLGSGSAAATRLDLAGTTAIFLLDLGHSLPALTSTAWPRGSFAAENRLLSMDHERNMQEADDALTDSEQLGLAAVLVARRAADARERVAVGSSPGRGLRRYRGSVKGRRGKKHRNFSVGLDNIERD